MLAMDKLGAKFNRNQAGVVMSVNSAAHAVASFDEDYVDAGRREVACSRQTGGARTQYQNRMFATHAGNCNDQPAGW